MPGITDKEWALLRGLIDKLLVAKADEDRLTAASNDADALVATAQAVLDQKKVVAAQA